MLSKPGKVRQVYRELRRSMGDRANSRELLECAAALVDLFQNGEEHHCRSGSGGRPFFAWALDVAFADGGWRVLAHETELLSALAGWED